MIKANDPSLESWIHIPSGCDFPIQNIPFGIAKANGKPFVASIIGEQVIDLNALASLGYFDDLKLDSTVFGKSVLNDFIKLGKPIWRAVRNKISDLFNAKNDALKSNAEAVKQILIPVREVEMQMPVFIGDYTDFYASKEHATNVGTMFRGAENALMPNWLHLPVGYHGRASSIFVSGNPVIRPQGQMRPNPNEGPVFGPSKLLDFEMEIGYITGQGKPLGDRISTAEADDYLFGLVLFNDWSARDIQGWEYVPLGPFLGKNFASTISPWIVTLDALEPFKTPAPKAEVEVLPYLQYKGDQSLDINLEVSIKTTQSEDENVVCKTNFKYMYWTMQQQLAHHTVNGCNINAGDMLASGTISGSTPDAYGSMLELSWRGAKPLPMSDGTERKFLQDGDTVKMTGFAEKNGVRIGFGKVESEILPAKEFIV